MKSSTVKYAGVTIALVSAVGVGAAQPWNLLVDGSSGSGVRVGPAGDDQQVLQSGGDAAGGDLTTQTGSRNKADSDNTVSTGNRRDTTTRTGTTERVNSDNPTGSGNSTSRNESTTSRDASVHQDRHDTTDPHGTGVVVGDHNTQSTVTNNNPAAKPDPPTGGVAAITRVAAADGGSTMGSAAVISVRVSKLPNNGNSLFLVCELLGQDTGSNLYYAKAELTERGDSAVAVQFGGPAAHDESLIGSVRLCSVVTAARSAGNVLRQLMIHDERGQQDDADGHPYDVQRTALPDGTTTISDIVRITVTRV